MHTFRSSLPIVVLLTGMFFLNFITRTVMAPLLVHLEQAFAINHTTATGLLLYQSVGFSISLFFSGIIASYLQHKKVIAVSVIASGSALVLLSFATGLWSARAGFALVGAATGLYLASGIAMLSSVTEKKDWGKAIAVHELAPNLAFVVSPLLIEAALLVTNWQGAIRLTGMLCLLGGLLFVAFARGGDFTGIRPTGRTYPALLGCKAVWAFAAITTLASILETSPYNVMPLFLVDERNMSTASANTLLAMSRAATPLLPLLGGWLVDRFHFRYVLYVCLAASGIVMAGISFAHGSVLTVLLVLQAGLPALMFPAVFAALGNAFAPAQQSLVLSLTMPAIALFSTGIVPLFLGFCGDTVGFGVGFMVIGASCMATLIAPRYMALQYAKLAEPQPGREIN